MSKVVYHYCAKYTKNGVDIEKIEDGVIEVNSVIFSQGEYDVLKRKILGNNTDFLVGDVKITSLTLL